jgi:Glycosyl transferase family 2
VEYVEQAITSILDQSGVRARVVLVDDTRTPQGQHKLIELSARISGVFYVRNTGIGLVDALNTGLEHVETEFCARMDADDIALHSRLRRQLELLEAHPNTVLVSGLVRYIDESGHLLPGIDWVERGIPIDTVGIRSRLKTENCIFHPAVMFRTAAVRDVGGYTNKYPHIEDYDLWLRLLQKGDFETLSYPVLLYRIHPTQIGAVHGSKQVIENAAIRKEFDFSSLDNFASPSPIKNLDRPQIEFCAVLYLHDNHDLQGFLHQLVDIPQAQLTRVLVVSMSENHSASQDQAEIYMSHFGLNADLTIVQRPQLAHALREFFRTAPQDLPVCFIDSQDKVVPTRIIEQCSEIANRFDAWALGQISTDGTVSSALYPDTYFSYPTNVSQEFSDLYFRSNITSAAGALAHFRFDEDAQAPSLIRQVVSHLQGYELREIPTYVGNLYSPIQKKSYALVAKNWLTSRQNRMKLRISNLRSRIFSP